MKNRKWFLLFLILFVFSLLSIRKSHTIFYQTHMTESEAAIFTGTVVGLYTAYRVYKAARAVYKLAKVTGKASKKVTRALSKSKRELAKKCNKLGDLYRSFKGGLRCKDSCFRIPLGSGRAKCYEKISLHIRRQIRTMRAERSGREKFERLCAATGAPRKRRSLDGRRKGEHVKQGKGHKQRIKNLDSSLASCEKILNRKHSRMVPSSESSSSMAQ